MRIGTVHLEYDELGKLIQAFFNPEIKIEADEDLLTKLSEIKNSDEKNICEQANTLFATWFSKMNEIELADRTEYHIINELVACEKFDSGAIKSCAIEFNFEHTPHN